MNWFKIHNAHRLRVLENRRYWNINFKDSGRDVSGEKICISFRVDFIIEGKMIIRCTSNFARKIRERGQRGTRMSSPLIDVNFSCLVNPQHSFPFWYQIAGLPHREILLYFDYRSWDLVIQRFIQPDGKTVSFRKTANRRVLGSMIDLKWQAQWTMKRRWTSMIEVNDVMNRNPMSYLGMDSPEGQIENLLDSIWYRTHDSAK